MYDLGLINGLIFKNQSYHNLNVYIQDGKIAKLSKEVLEASIIYDCNNNLVFPGIIDPHTHFDLDLGKMRSKDDFNHGTKAAVFGGVTTIIDFLVPVDNDEDLEKEFYKRVEESRQSSIDYKFHACVKNPKDIPSIVLKMEELGLNTVKLFTTYSDSNRRTYDEEIIELLLLSSVHDFLITAHIEADDLINLNEKFEYRDLPVSRPTFSETGEALKIAQYVKETDGNLYMVHLSSGQTLKLLKEKYSDILNKKFFIESCPHYFMFNNKILDEKNGYLYTMAPPLRGKSEMELLHHLIADVYTIGTDHCTFDKNEKNKRLLKDIPLGVGGVEYSFDIMYSLFGEEIVDKMTLNVAKAHKLFPKKGIIEEGADADLFVYELKENVLSENHSNTDHFIYDGFKVKGQVKSTITNGIFALKDREFIKTSGTLLNMVVK